MDHDAVKAREPQDDAPARQCLALGCTRKTKNAHGFCWQHAEMADLVPRKRCDCGSRVVPCDHRCPNWRGEQR